MSPIFKRLLIIVTAVSVISDSMLIPFYPQYFAEVFAINDEQYVGFYLAVYCLVVMLAFPLWAALAKRMNLLQLLVITQLAAGVLSVGCYWATDLAVFWAISMLMMLFKASYLLVYPFILSREAEQNHGATIGVLAVITEFCAILGALAGGVMLQWFEARQAFLVMAAGDFIQTAACIWLIRQGMDAQSPAIKEEEQVWVTQGALHAPDETKAVPDNTPGNGLMAGATMLKLSVLMLLFYFSAFLSYHFFIRYWGQLSTYNGELVSAVVFAIPAFMALLGLWYNHRSRRQIRIHSGLATAIVLTAIGALMQSIENELWLLIGRCLFGWALFQAIVRLDLLLFQLSTPKSYAEDYSRIRISQSLGVLLAAYAAGSIMATLGGQWMFVLSAAGLGISFICFIFLLKTEIDASRDKARLVEE